jgi:hypothetical protein
MRVRRYFLLLGLLLIVWAIVYVLSARQGRSLEAHLVPTAESLLLNPLNKPDFIGYIQPSPEENLSRGEMVRVHLYPGELMKKGNSYKELEDWMVKNTTFSINNHPLPFYTPVGVEFPGGLREVVDGQETGSMTFYFTPDLEIGYHIATLHTKDLSGNDYSYTWAFKVE